MVDKILSIFGSGNSSATNYPSDDQQQPFDRLRRSPTVELIEDSPKYRSFRGRVALKRLSLDEDCTKAWSYHECGPREVRCPMVFLPPVTGTADVFFQQVEYLAERGYRVISAEYPSYFTMEEFCEGLLRLLRYFKVKQVHLFGASLGGFLAQKFAQYNPSVIASLFLCNAFGDTSRFKFVNTVPLVWLAPAPLLRSYFITKEVPEDADEQIRAAAHFMSSKVATLSQADLLARLTLNLTSDYVRPERLQSLAITVMDVFDHCAHSSSTRLELYKLYPSARRAHLKQGGNYPYLSRPEEVNMHLLVHLRQFNHTERAACVHFLDVKEGSADLDTSSVEYHSNSLESSVEVARVAEEQIARPPPTAKAIAERIEEVAVESAAANSDMTPKLVKEAAVPSSANAQVDHLV